MSNFQKRKKLYSTIEKMRSSHCLLYVLGDRRRAETKIHAEVMELFTDHLDSFGPTKKISLILYTTGGRISAAWGIINLLQSFADDLEVIVIAKALSSGTLISLGADRIVMTKQGLLGPIDPSLDHPLNPQKPGARSGNTVMVSVEAIQSYIQTLREELGIDDPASVAKIITSLAEKVHPLVLGQAFRSQIQVRAIATRLLESKMSDPDRINKIVEFLCRSSGSHDYSINRREAAELGLVIEKPDNRLYKVLREIHHSYVDELELRDDWDIRAFLGNQVSTEYSTTRGLIESIEGGAHQYIREGKISRRLVSRADTEPKEVIDDRVGFEGWRVVV